MKTEHSDPCNEGMEIVAYLAGVMPPEDRPRFEEHLARCDACRARLVAIHRMGGDLPETVEPVSLDRAWRRVEQALDQWKDPIHTSDTALTDPTDSVSGPPPAGDLKHVARVIHLRARVRKPLRPHDMGALAAATEQAAPLASITYTADDSEVLGKVARDESGNLLLYLMADDGSILEGSKVVARDEEASLTAEGAPDAYGVVPLTDTSSWNPEKMRVELHLRR
jgi:hypothetical protein